MRRENQKLYEKASEDSISVRLQGHLESLHEELRH